MQTLYRRIRNLTFRSFDNSPFKRHFTHKILLCKQINYITYKLKSQYQKIPLKTRIANTQVAITNREIRTVPIIFDFLLFELSVFGIKFAFLKAVTTNLYKSKVNLY